MSSGTSDRRPFAEHRASIDGAIDRLDPIEPILAALIADPDPALLAHALDRLTALDRLDEIPGAAIARAPDAHLGRALRDPARLTPALVELIVRTLDALPSDRIAAACFLIRWVAKADSDRWQALEAHAIAAAVAGCSTDPAQVTDRMLLRVPGRAYAEIGRGAAERLRRFAETVLGALERQPKSLSQVGAEALLARRVYTDPTHFLMELLQNAEDAGASWWSVAIEHEQLVVEHDGVPFDARDVVGVLSIGQTTKLGDRIGQFGVGFKSVYAISDRPRIHAGPFHFEIADMSIPRRLLPVDVAEGVTRLVLPLRDPDSRDVGWRAILSGARRLPETVLLTLNRITRIELSAPGWQRAVHRRAHQGIVELTDGASSWWRILAAPSTSSVPSLRVGIHLDDRARPIPAVGPTVFCYLPTRDRPGLEVLIHARFPLPVDRERVDPDHPTTHRILEEAGRMLSQRVSAIAQTDGAWALLALVPIPSALAAGPWRRVFDAFVSASRGRRMLPLARGGAVEPDNARWLPPGPLADVLSRVDASEGPALVVPPDAACSKRVERMGVLRLEATEIIDWLASWSEATRPPESVSRGIASILRGIAATVVEEPSLTRRLATLRVLPDADGDWHSASEVFRAPARIRPMCGRRPLLSPALDDASGLQALWTTLGIRVVDDALLVAELIDEDTRAPLLAEVEAADCLRWMAGLEQPDLDRLAGVPLMLDRHGVRRPATGPDALYTAGDDPIGRWAQQPSSGRPLVVSRLQRDHRSTLRRWGVVDYDLEVLLANPPRDLPSDTLAALHDALDATADELGPRRAARLASAALFPDTAGRPRPLHGPAAAVRPAVAELRALLPDAPWLDPRLEGARHVDLIKPVTIGAIDLVDALLDTDAPLYAPIGSRGWLAIVEWLSTNPVDPGPVRRERLASAAIWLPVESGVRVPLDRLRSSSDEPAWADLYRAWGSWQQPAAEAIALARALTLGERLHPADGQRLIDDLTGGPLPEVVLDRVPAALAALADRRQGVDLSRLFAAPIHRDDVGGFGPLGDWRVADPTGVHRVPDALRPVLAAGPRRLMGKAYQATISDVLDALELPSASSRSVLDLAETALGDPQHVRDALLSLGPVDVDDRERRRWSALPIWPTANGGWSPSVALVDPTAVAALPEQVQEVIAPNMRVASSALTTLPDLAPYFRFLGVRDALAKVIGQHACPGEPLDAQPNWLNAVDRVAAIRRTFDAPSALPLWVDARDRLTTGPLWVATAGVLGLIRHLSLSDRVAHPDDREAHALGRPLPARMVLASLADETPEPIPVDRHPVLRDANARDALYRWLLAVGDEIDGDEQARGQLGRAALWLTRAQMLRTPRALMPLDPGDPLARALIEDAALDWTAADEVPAPLLARLRQWFRLDARQLTVAVEHILRAQMGAAGEGDVARSAGLLDLLAALLDRAVRPDTSKAALVTRFKLHRRLRLADTDGQFGRPKLIASPPDGADGLADWLPAPPRAIHAAYSVEVRALARAAGAPPELPVAQLQLGLDATLDSPDRRLSRFLAVAQRAARTPALVERLDLRTRRWLVDARGASAAPGDLIWSSPEVDALLGPIRGRRPHRLVVDGLPPALIRRLPLRRADDLEPSEVAACLQDSTPADEVVLRWFDEGLRTRRLDREGVARALAGLTIFLDDDGRSRAADRLVRDLPTGHLGRRRGGFREGRAYPRLCGALGIPVEPNARVIDAVLDEIAADVRRGGRILEAEPELIDVLPRLTLGSPTHNPPPVVLVQTSSGLAISSSRDAVWPIPNLLARAALDSGAGIPLMELGPFADGDLEDPIARWGLPTVRDLWRPVAGRRSEGERLPALEARLSALATVLPGLAADAPMGTLQACRVDDADRLGRIGEVDVRWPRRAAVESGVLRVIDPDDAHAAAEALVWDLLAPRRDALGQRRLAERVARLLICGTAEAMALLLDAEGPTPNRPRPMARNASEAPRRTADSAPAIEGPSADDEPPSGEDGVWSRLRAWWQGKPADEEPEAPRRSDRSTAAADRTPPDQTAFQPPDTSTFFQPKQTVESQIRAAPGWLATRQTPTEIGFAFAPARLSGVFQYGPALIADHYDRRSRRWVPAHVESAWSTPSDFGRYRVAFTGRLPTGEAALAVPLFGRVLDVDGGPSCRRIDSRSRRPVLRLSRPSDVTYTVELGHAPRFVDRDIEASASLLTPTAPDSELPAECHALVDEVTGAAPRVRVATIGRFVQRHYRYDPSYLEDPQHARWLRRVSRGRANPHLAALHAARDGRHLGAGVCYELNVLVCELLRRSGVPAAIATGWTFDRGWVDQPDHLWAMALLATPDGPRWMPVDASSTRDGRPLHASPRPTGPHRARAPTEQGRAPSASTWRDAPQSKPTDRLPLNDLVRVIRHVESNAASTFRSDAERIAAARRLLSDPDRSTELLRLLNSTPD